MKEKKVYSITTNLSRFGGAQKVLVDVHNGLKGIYCSKIIGFQKFQRLHNKYEIHKAEYIRVFNPFSIRNSILIVHARSILPFIILLNRILFLNLSVIYVSHSVYSTYKHLTFFPLTIISISNRVTQNLELYFGIRKENITLVNNGILDKYRCNEKRRYKEDGKIKILYPARICVGKQQLELVKHLENNLIDRIEIHFAGVGSDYDKLVQVCTNSSIFKALGFIHEIDDIIEEYDYVMLYSLQEGLPTSLLEGIMHGKPLLTNDIGGSLEICEPNVNGIVLEDNWDHLIKQLNNLDDITHDEYMEMSKKSRQCYLDKFRYDLMIEKYIGVIRKINKK